MTREVVRSSSSTALIVLLAVLAGVTITFSQYQFGHGNQADHLSFFYRALDSTYLPNDFYTNFTTEYGPRTYYVALITAIARLVTLPVTLFVLALISNTLVALITGLFVRRYFGTEAALLAIPFALLADRISIGGANALFGNDLVPHLLAMPLALGAIWAGIAQRPVICSMLAWVAALIHPQIGLETGAIVLGVLFLYQILLRKAQFMPFLIAGGILAVSALIWIIPDAAQTRISNEQFIYLVAYLRHPHHYLPSTFSPAQYIVLLLSLLTAAIAWWKLRPDLPPKLMNLLMLVMVLALAFIACGYVFVEVIPTRIWTTLQTFRMLYMVNWLGHVLVAVYIASLFRRDEVYADVEGYALVISAVSPTVLAAGFILHTLKGQILRILRLPRLVFALLPILIALVYSGVTGVFFSPNLAVLLVFALIFQSLVSLPPRRLRTLLVGAAYGGVLAFFVFAFLFPNTAYAPITQVFVQPPVFDLSDYTGDLADNAAYAHQQTPPQAIFLTPPDGGLFRLLAERALIVDFKGFPFQDQGMVEWQRRILDVYGASNYTGFEYMNDASERYRQITDAQLQRIRESYNTSYALLFSETETEFPVLFQSGNLKIVALDTDSTTIFP